MRQCQMEPWKAGFVRTRHHASDAREATERLDNHAGRMQRAGLMRCGKMPPRLCLRRGFRGRTATG